MESTQPFITQDPPLIDIRKLRLFVILGIADYRELLGDVLREVPEQLVNIRDFIRQGDSVQRKQCAHSLRGILGYFGCVAMTARFTQVEAEETIMPEQADAIYAELETLWQNSLAAIREWEKSVPEFACEETVPSP